MLCLECLIVAAAVVATAVVVVVVVMMMVEKKRARGSEEEIPTPLEKAGYQGHPTSRMISLDVFAALPR